MRTKSAPWGRLTIGRYRFDVWVPVNASDARHNYNVTRNRSLWVENGRYWMKRQGEKVVTDVTGYEMRHFASFTMSQRMYHNLYRRFSGRKQSLFCFSYCPKDDVLYQKLCNYFEGSLQ